MMISLFATHGQRSVTVERLIWLGLALFVLCSGPARASDALHNGESPPAARASDAPAKAEGEGAKDAEPGKPKPAKPKPKPKRVDKDKNCQWDITVNLDVDGKHITVPQLSLKNVMRGLEADDDGYELYADPDRLLLRVKDPEGNWFIANMTRLGDPNEGCIYFLVGDLKAVTGEPPLF